MPEQAIRTVNIKGKEYVDVAERVRLTNADKGFSMIEQRQYAMADRFFFSVTIEIDSKRYMGDAEIKFNAPRNTPDGTNPIECAQTSALGRALGFAGYGALDSIASADEVLRAVAEQTAQQTGPRVNTPPPARPRTPSNSNAPYPATEGQIQAAVKLGVPSAVAALVSKNEYMDLNPQYPSNKGVFKALQSARNRNGAVPTEDEALEIVRMSIGQDRYNTIQTALGDTDLDYMSDEYPD